MGPTRATGVDSRSSIVRALGGNYFYSSETERIMQKLIGILFISILVRLITIGQHKLDK